MRSRGWPSRGEGAGPAIRAGASWRDATGAVPPRQDALDPLPGIGGFWRLRLRLWMVCLAPLAPAALPAAATATTYTVDSTGDLPDATPGDNVCKDTTDPPANAK